MPPPNLSWQRYNSKGGQTPAWTALSAVTGSTSDPLVLTLTNALQLALNVKVGVTTGGYATAAAAAVRDKATDVYKTASGPLATAIGTFCSFCETSVPNLLEVEHVANKANYPTYMTAWENFVLACSPCNSRKGDDPLRAVAAQFPPPPALDPNSASDAAFYDRIRQQYAWPDWWDGTFQFFWIDFQMSADNGATWESMTYADAADLEDNYLVGSDLNQRRVWANLRHDGILYYNVPVAVVVQPWGANLVGLCGLNEPGLSPNLTYDRRMFNRTLAWFTILDTMRPLMQITDEDQFLRLWPLIQYSSVANGFWSLWVTLLSQYNDFDQPPHSLGYWLYGDPNAATFYPGTKTNNIQLPPRQ
ncbi:MAG TPA: HNH endonuclease signature motif containing protein [Thermoanaerobaculia bacterium]